MAVTLVQQIQEVERELSLRAAVFPRQVYAKKMRQGEADEHMTRMQCVLATLKWLQANEAKIRETLGPRALKPGEPIDASSGPG